MNPRQKRQPALPLPSNTIVEEYPNGAMSFTIPAPTSKILQEYQEAIRNNPDDVRLRMFYSSSLRDIGDRQTAALQLQEALRTNVNDAYVHSLSGELLREQGQVDAAIIEYEEALHLMNQDIHKYTLQTQARVRWRLSEAFQQQHKDTEAKGQLQQAVALVENVATRNQRDERLLEQLREKLKEAPVS